MQYNCESVTENSVQLTEAVVCFLRRGEYKPHDASSGVPAVAGWIVPGILVAIVLMAWKEIDKTKREQSKQTLPLLPLSQHTCKEAGQLTEIYTAMKSQFTFSRELQFHNHPYFMYKVFDEQLKLVGNYYCRDHAAAFEFENRKFNVQEKQHGLSRSTYELIDEQQSVIGEYKFPAWSWKNASLRLGENNFTCDPVNLWPNYTIVVVSKPSAVMYQFKIKTPLISFKRNTQRPFTGTVTLWENNKLLLFAGLFLVEALLGKWD